MIGHTYSPRAAELHAVILDDVQTICSFKVAIRAFSQIEIRNAPRNALARGLAVPTVYINQSRFVSDGLLGQKCVTLTDAMECAPLLQYAGSIVTIGG